jgi:predicted nucleic acid-binding protein
MRTVYIETSVVSYYCSRPSRDLVVAAHQQVTREWWDTRLGTAYIPVISIEVLEEIGEGDFEAAARRKHAVAGIKVLPTADEVRQVADRLAQALRLEAKAFPDALHIAFAVVFKCDYLVTWNCRHIAGAEAQGIIESVCRQHGWHVPRCCTPEQLMEAYDER